MKEALAPAASWDLQLEKCWIRGARIWEKEKKKAAEHVGSNFILT